MKLLTFAQFKAQLGLSPPVSAYASWLVVMVPALELASVAALLFPRTRLLGFYGVFSLMVMFTTYNIIILKFSQYVPCSCGGILQDMTWRQHLVFNIGATILAALGVLVSPSWQGHRYVLGSWRL